MARMFAFLLSLMFAVPIDAWVPADPAPRDLPAAPSDPVSPTPAPAPAVPDEKLMIEITRFLAPYTAARVNTPAGETADEERMWLTLYAIVYEYAQRSLFGEPGAVEALIPEADPQGYHMILTAEQFCLAARDYMGWTRTSAEVLAYFSREPSYVAPDGRIALPLGDGEMKTLPCLTTCAREGGEYVVTLTAAVLDYAHQPARTAQARIAVAPKSIFGYTLIAYDDAPLIEKACASSQQSAYPVDHLFDSDTATAWVPREPVGAWVEVAFSRPVRVEAIVLFPGYGKSDDLLQKNNRVKAATLTLSNGDEYAWNLRDALETHDDAEFPIPGGACIVTGLRLKIDAVYPGTRYNDTCISALSVRPYYYDAFKAEGE